MAETDHPDPPAAAAVGAHLHLLAELLREADHVGPAAQGALAELVDELSRALTADTVPAAELARLADRTAALIRAMEAQQAEPGLLGRARDRLEAAVAAVEAEAPVTAGVARRLMDTLANLGI